jgi:hypothetical protein
MGLFTIFNIGIVVLISFLAFNFFRMFKPFSTFTHLNDEKCEITKGTFAVEDFVEYGDYLLGSADDRKSLWFGDNSKAENGYIVIFNPKSKKITKIPDIEGFPKDIAFHPHGIYLKGNNLYVINHAYGKGSERVEVLQVQEDASSARISLKYLKSFIFGDEFQGMLNDLAVIESDKFYVTTWKAHPDNIDGPSHDSMSLIKILFTNLLGMKKTKIYFCDGYESTNKPKCQIVVGGEAHVNNGIAVDDTNTHLYVADTLPSSVRKFKINKDYSLTLLKTIDVRVHPDNLIFDKINKKIYTAGMFDMWTGVKVLDSLHKGKEIPSDLKTWAGTVTIDTLNDDKVDIVMSHDSFFKGVSVGLKVNDRMILGSFFEEGIMICPLK